MGRGSKTWREGKQKLGLTVYSQLALMAEWLKRSPLVSAIRIRFPDESKHFCMPKWPLISGCIAEINEFWACVSARYQHGWYPVSARRMAESWDIYIYTYIYVYIHSAWDIKLQRLMIVEQVHTQHTLVTLTDSKCYPKPTFKHAYHSLNFYTSD